MPNSDNDTALTPIILCSSGVNAFSAFDFAFKIAFSIRSSFISSCFCGESVKYTLSILFAPAATAPINGRAVASWRKTREPLATLVAFPEKTWLNKGASQKRPHFSGFFD